MKLTQDASRAASFALRGDDAITYFVLSRILKGPCEGVYTDGERAMICLSALPYPVWAYCRDEGDAEAVAAVGACLKAHFPFEDGYRVNLSYGLLDALRREDEAFARARIQMNLLAYRLDAPHPPEHPCGGRMEAAAQADLDTLAVCWQDARMEMEHVRISLEDARRQVGEKLAAGQQFVWRDARGEITAMTSFRIDGAYGSIAGVYTRPEHRRRGYASHLVYGVTQRILDLGLTPTLYTNADYAASNACYKKIGYAQVGSLCTVGK